MGNLYVEREVYVKDDKAYSNYFIKGVIRGKEVKIQLAPPNKDVDKGGFAVLDVVFGDENKLELVVTPFEIKGIDGKIITGKTYSVRSYDENGEVYECKVVPARTSDKNFLNMICK